MTRSEAEKYRAQIEGSAADADDSTALEQKWMYPAWEVGKAYAAGDRVRYADKLYKCVQAHTSLTEWTPDATPALWVEVSIEEWPLWKQPTGAHDAYNTGDKCTYNGKHYICEVNGNVYPPDMYGWRLAE